MKYAYMHANGCGKIAFYYAADPKRGDTVKSSDATLLNGEHPKPGDPVICGSCGAHIPSCLERANLKACGPTVITIIETND